MGTFLLVFEQNCKSKLKKLGFIIFLKKSLLLSLGFRGQKKIFRGWEFFLGYLSYTLSLRMSASLSAQSGRALNRDERRRSPRFCLHPGIPTVLPANVASPREWFFVARPLSSAGTTPDFTRIEQRIICCFLCELLTLKFFS